MLEKWKTIKEDGVLKDAYQISNKGRIRCRTRVYYVGQYKSKRVLKGHVMKPSITAKRHSSGYYAIPLTDGKNNKRSFMIHRLVAKYFLSDWDENLTVNHIDENTLNNNVTNLEMITQKENNHHGKRRETIAKKRDERIEKGLYHNQTPLKLENTHTKEVIVFPSKKRACKFLGVDQRKVDNVLKGKRSSLHNWKISQISTAEYRKNFVPKT